MSSQLQFNEWPLRARRTDPPSSHEAARRAGPRASSQAGRILAAIYERPGLKARDLAVMTGIDAYIVRKRTADLRAAKWVRNQSAEAVLGGEELRWFPA